ncbi:hypothetical protein PIB30_021819 [Stylosanthes scabra]|uniref:Transposase (putative) gypsy type domain-containing protein n=1 Tax=Stylosanthes scabra TaxID=79078 RepID=A0ABU6X9M6_9FABA|nr:hypothetical protein [Stylosanthes scabra]
MRLFDFRVVWEFWSDSDRSLCYYDFATFRLLSWHVVLFYFLMTWQKKGNCFFTFFERGSSGSGFRGCSNRPIISTCPFVFSKCVREGFDDLKSKLFISFLLPSLPSLSILGFLSPRKGDLFSEHLCFVAFLFAFLCVHLVEEAVLTQPSVVESDSLLEFHRNFPLTEGDYVLEAVGPSDRVPFRAGEGETHFLWVYKELFTRLGVRLPFSDFQRDVMTRCRVAVSQLHLNGWGFILTFEKVCLHYGFRPIIRLFFYIYDILILPTSKGYISFRSWQGHKLFDSYEDSIQEFKWHYFKVLPAPDSRSFWLDHENKPFPWVYWNPEVKGFTVFNLEPLEMAAFKFLVSLPGGLPKRNRFICRWILDNSDAKVGKFLDDLLDVKMKKSKLDHLMAMMADPSRMGPRAILPTDRPPTPAESSSQVSPAPTAPEPHKAKKQTSKHERAKVIDLGGEEGLKEDLATDLQPKRRKKKAKEDDAFERALGDDSAWEHDVDPIKVAFPESFNYRKALNTSLTSALVRETLTKMPPEQLLGESYHLSTKSLACLRVGVETSLAAKVKAEKELSATLDQIEILKGDRDSALAFLPLKEKLEEDNGVLKAQLESSQLSLDGEKKRPKAAEKQAEPDEIQRVEESSSLRSRMWRKSLRIQEVMLEQHPEAITLASQLVAGDVAGV